MQAHDYASRLQLKDFDLFPGCGFFPEELPREGIYPIDLPRCMNDWALEVQKLARNLPKYLVTNKVREEISKLERIWERTEIDAEIVSALKRPVLNALMRDVSFLGNAWVFGGVPDLWQNDSASRIPPWLALPWCLFARELGTTPTCSYWWYCVYNWQYIGSPNKPLLLENTALIRNFLGGFDEEGFVKIHWIVEDKWRDLPEAAILGMQAVAEDNPFALEQALNTIGLAERRAVEVMYQMWKWCSENIYFDRVRLHIAGWLHNPALPRGVVYEGVEGFKGVPQKFGGETGAQSSGTPLQYAALDIRHEDDDFLTFLLGMRRHMPAGHRSLIETIEKLSRNGLSVREYVLLNQDSHPSLRAVYRMCVAALEEFLAVHYRFVECYIARQEQKLVHNPTERGTGGTKALEYLAKHVKRVREIKESF